jgi:hypothetical protein
MHATAPVARRSCSRSETIMRISCVSCLSMASPAELQRLLLDAGASREIGYRLAHAPFLYPGLSIAAVALVLLLFGWVIGQYVALRRMRWAIIWSVYLIAAAAIAAWDNYWLHAPHPGGESTLGSYLIEAAVLAHASIVLIALGFFLIGMHFAQRARQHGAHSRSP